MKERRTETRLVGRRDDRQRAVSCAEDPTIGAVLFTGPVGIGKSRLGEGVLSELTERGWVGFGISATEQVSAIPYSAVSELIPGVLDELDDPTAESARLSVLRGLERALGLDGDRPVVVAIDHPAAIDEMSCDLLVHLAANRRIFIVASQADGDQMTEALRRLTPASPSLVEVGPFTISDTAELAAELLGGPVGPGLVRALQHRTAGYPLFIRDLVVSARTAGDVQVVNGVHQLAGRIDISPTLGRQIVLRLGLLSEVERAVLELLALGGPLGVDVLNDVADARTLESMEQRGLLQTQADGRRLRARLRHPLHGEAIAAEISPLARRRRQRELVDLLTSRPTRRAEDPIVILRSRLEVGEDLPADELVAGAYGALRLDRIADATALAEAAYRTEESESTLLAVAETLTRQGRFVEADAHLVQATPPTDDWGRARRAIRRASNQLWGFADSDAALAIDDECVATISEPAARERVVAHQAWVDYCDGRSADALARLALLSSPTASGVHPDLRFAIVAAQAPAMVLAGQVAAAAALAQRAWDEGWGADTEYGSRGQHLIALGWALLYRGDLAGASFVADQAIEGCRSSSETTALLFFLDLAGWIEVFRGDLLAATAHFDEAVDIATELSLTSPVRSSLAALVICHAQRGDAASADVAWERLADIPDAPEPRGGAQLQLAAAWRQATAGDHGAASSMLREAADGARRRGSVILELALLFDVARLGLASDVDAERAATARKVCEGPLFGLFADGVAGVAAADPAALDRVANALADMGLALWASELAALASDLWAAGGDQRAATASQRSSDQARADLPASATPALSRARTVEPLTKREREIAGLAARGASNADMAERLHVSIRTVETHLHKIYRKLGVSGRGELADALGSELG